jgi:hypothetical protein
VPHAHVDEGACVEDAPGDHAHTDSPDEDGHDAPVALPPPVVRKGPLARCKWVAPPTLLPRSAGHEADNVPETAESESSASESADEAFLCAKTPREDGDCGVVMSTASSSMASSSCDVLDHTHAASDESCPSSPVLHCPASRQRKQPTTKLVLPPATSSREDAGEPCRKKGMWAPQEESASARATSLFTRIQAVTREGHGASGGGTV